MFKRCFAGIAVAVGCFITPAFAQFSPLPIPGADVKALYAASATTWLAGTQGGGVHRTSDQGASWSAVPTDVSVRRAMRYVNQLAGVGNTVYAATEGGVFRSADGGATWVQRTREGAQLVSVDPANPEAVLIGVRGAGIYFSTNGAATLQNFSAGLPSLDLRALLFVNSTTAYVGLYEYANGITGGVYRSQSGSAWTSFNSPGGVGNLPNRKVTALEVDGSGALYVGAGDTAQNTGGLFKTTGSGWQTLSPYPGQGPSFMAVSTLHRDRNNGNRIWVGASYVGPTVTSNAGVSFEFANTVAEQNLFASVYAFLTAPGFSGMVRSVEGVGLFRTAAVSPSSETSTALSLRAARVLAFAPSPSQPTTIYAGLDANGGVLKSTDSGASWTRIITGFENKVGNPEFRRLHGIRHIAVSPTDPNSVHAAADLVGLYYTTNGGSNWTAVSSSPFVNSPVGAFIRPGGLAALATGQFFYSLFTPSAGFYRGAANSWAAVPQPTTTIFGPERVVVGASGRVYVLLSDDRPVVSTNGGTSFTRVSFGDETQLGFSRIWALSLAENPNTTSTVVASTNKGFFRSTDGGSTYARVNATGIAQTQMSGMVYAGSTLFAGDRLGNVYCSTNNGTSWSTKGALVEAVNDLRVSGSTLYVITDGAGVQTASVSCP